MAAGYLSALHFLLPARGSCGTGDNMISVSGVYYGVTIAVENNGRHGWLMIGGGRRRKSLMNRLGASRRMQR